MMKVASKNYQIAVRFPEELLDLVDTLAGIAGLKRGPWIASLIEDACADAGPLIAKAIKAVDEDANRRKAQLEALQERLARQARKP